MLHVPLGPTRRRCDGVTRRDFLQIGGLGALSLPALLRARQARAEGQGRAAEGASAQSVILVYLGGGLSHHDSFDPKPDAPDEVRGQYGTLPTKLPGVRFGDKLPLLAGINDKFALMRSGTHGNDHHETATNWVLSGRFGSPFGDYPAIGAVVSHELGYRGPMPPYFAVPRNPSFTWELGKSAFLGGRYESFKTGDPNNDNFRVQDITVPGGLTVARIDRRQSLRQAIDGLARQVESDDQLRTLDEFQRRAIDLVLSTEARRAFDIHREDPRLRERYGRNTTGQSCLLARRLVESGVRFVTVNSGGWDHHAKIFESLDRRLPELDLALSALINDLDARAARLDPGRGDGRIRPLTQGQQGRRARPLGPRRQSRLGGRRRAAWPRDRLQRRPGGARHRAARPPRRRRRHDLQCCRRRLPRLLDHPGEPAGADPR